MSVYLDRARELRASAVPHYSCAQSVLLPFIPLTSLTEEEGLMLASNLGGGMRIAATCGAFVGALLTLGLCGVEDPTEAQRIAREIRLTHSDAIDCKTLLKMNAEKGLEKKPHCDALVFQAVELVETVLRERGVIPGGAPSAAEKT